MNNSWGQTHIRSLLFLPATRLERIDKALASGADLVVLDLEDGVGPADKATARAALAKLFGQGQDRLERVAIRINALSTANGIRDMAALLDWENWPAMLILPKVEAPAEVRQILSLTSGRTNPPAVLLTLETAAGIFNAPAIAGAARPNSLLCYGSADHMAETGGTMTEASLSFGRAQVLNAAAMHALPALDGVWLNYRDVEGLTAEAEHVRSLGFSGKLAIHPDQIAPINKVFTPSAREYAEAVEMLEMSAAAGDGAFAFNGKMVDAPVLERAKRTVRIATKETA